MPQVIVAVDVVGSTGAKEEFGEKEAIKRIGAALQLAEEALCAADSSLCIPTASAGDAILLVGGKDVPGVYRAAVVHQCIFQAWHYERLAIKIAIGYGSFETVAPKGSGQVALRGTDLDLLHRLLDVCPPAGVVVSSNVYHLLRDANFGDRLIEVHEELKGFGPRTLYESNGGYHIPPHLRQRANRRREDARFRGTVFLSRPAALICAGVLLIIFALVLFGRLQ